MSAQLCELFGRKSVGHGDLAGCVGGLKHGEVQRFRR
jgi:hypothetical protein